MYTPTIGLEIHAELKTKTKMFCASKNDPDEVTPNTNVCPVCMGHPGTLPTANKEAVRSVLRVGKALKGTLANFTEFDRKNYFYPDIPKGFQISQYKYPLVSSGVLNDVRITRVHLEEDTARSQHTSGGTLIDFNRAGVPLMELVTEPEIHSGEEASLFARELQLLLRTLGVSDANLEKGEMRIEANVSVSKTNTLGTKVEIKNLNSFRSVERSIAYEVKRQSDLLEKGERVVQETRGWDEAKGVTQHQRMKEGSADYRYFPEPDLPKVVRSEVSEFCDEELLIPELPSEKRARYRSLGIKEEDVEHIVSSLTWSSFFDAVLTFMKEQKSILRAVNILTTELVGILRAKETEEHRVSPESFAELVDMAEKSELSSRGVKEVLAYLVQNGGGARETGERLGVLQVHDTGKLQELVAATLAEHAGVVQEYQKGKKTTLGFLVGDVMKRSRGSANPQVVREELIKVLGE
jgi:aspartyl-tRNA(Asn)/glutamyl-tRNA(Gln) amidotransferase subunit B